MATAKKLPSGSWRCLVFDHWQEELQPDGSVKRRRIYKSFTVDDPTKRGKRTCEKLAADFAAWKSESGHKCSAPAPTLEEAISTYISARAPILSPATTVTYTNQLSILREYIPRFLERRIDTFDRDTLQELVSDLLSRIEPKTVKNYYSLCQSALREAGELVPPVSLPKCKRPDLYIPSDEDIKRLIETVTGTELEIPVLLAAFCTMRRGEICGLSLSDISGNIIHVQRARVVGPGRQWILKTPKTASSDRYIEAPAFVIDKIRQRGAITSLTPDQLTHTFGETIKKCGFKHFRFHDLRHYSASVQHALGIPDAYIMQRGGWRSDGVLKSVYRHAMSDRQQMMSQIANQHFEELMQHEMQHGSQKDR